MPTSKTTKTTRPTIRQRRTRARVEVLPHSTYYVSADERTHWLTRAATIVQAADLRTLATRYDRWGTALQGAREARQEYTEVTRATLDYHTALQGALQAARAILATYNDADIYTLLLALDELSERLCAAAWRCGRLAFYDGIGDFLRGLCALPAALLRERGWVLGDRWTRPLVA